MKTKELSLFQYVFVWQAKKCSFEHKLIHECNKILLIIMNKLLMISRIINHLINYLQKEFEFISFTIFFNPLNKCFYFLNMIFNKHI